MNLKRVIKYHILNFVLLQIISFLLTGCSLNKINLLIKCSNDSNSNNAVVISILQLANSEKFQGAPQDLLLKDPKDVLGDDLIDSKVQTLVPGDLRHIRDFEIKKGVLFIGIIGDFHSPSENRWRQIYNLQSGKHNLEILVLKNSVEIRGK